MRPLGQPVDIYNEEQYMSEYPSNGRNGFAVTALVTGILAVVFSFIPFIGIIAFVLAPIAITFGALALKSDKRGQALAGLICGGVGLVISVLWLTLFTVAVGGAAVELDEYFVCVDAAVTAEELAAC